LEKSVNKKRLDIKAFITLFAALLLPGALQAGVATGFELPDTGYVSNVVIDIVEHNGAVWFATSDGVNFSFDDGDTWLSYDGTNGLPSTSVSALYSIASATGSPRIWVGTTHEEEFSGELFVLSDGVSYSDNNGDLWTQIDFGESGQNIPFVWGGDRTVFDITGHYDAADADDNWLFFASFAGGFLASRDGGMNWRRVYSSVEDSVQFNTPNVPPSFSNRYFSCAADTSHGDSLFIWAGTAEGFFQYVYAIPREKLYSEYLSMIVPCDSCPSEDSNYVYFAGDNGFTRAAKTGGPYIHRFEVDGLPGRSVVSIIDFAGKLFVGAIDPSDSSSTGLAESSDFGESFSASTSFTETGLNRRVLDFAVMNDRLYLAAEAAGLYVSSDTGSTWEHIFVDSSDVSPGNGFNTVNALNAWGDTLRIGTNSGLANLYMTATGTIDSAIYYSFPEDAVNSSQVIRVKTQRFADTDVIWTANRPLTDLGMPMVGRSTDGGRTFASMQVGAVSYDFDFFGDSAYVVGAEGIRLSEDGTNPSIIEYVREYRGTVTIDSLHHNIITDMVILGDTVYLATDDGYAVSYDRTETWDVRRPNLDTLGADVVIQYTSIVEGVVGEFIPALAVQYLPDTLARIWASNRPALYGANGISVGRIDAAIRDILDDEGNVIGEDTIYVYNWDSVHDDFAWNFAFNGDTVFAATNDGLIYARGDNILQGIREWETLQLEDASGDPLVMEGAPVYAVEVAGDYLWVGTGDRTVRIELTAEGFGEQKSLFVTDATDEVYAFPVPFSHSLDLAVDFHFRVDEDADITLEIYDFAMNLVRRVIDNEPYAAGVYPTEGTGRRIWDGTNGNGDRVAVGVYYFKVEYSTGEVRWGKLAVIP